MQRSISVALVVLACLIYACTASPPPGCECIGKDKAGELIKKGTKATLGSVGADFGSYCAAWEDGACLAANSCDAGPGHSCGTDKECKALWSPQYNFDVDQTWCCDAWCYVDPITCTEDLQRKYDLDVVLSWLATDANSMPLYYSYATCEDDQSFPKASLGALYDKNNDAVTLKSYSKYTSLTCPYKVEPTGCECWNNNDALDRGSYSEHSSGLKWRQFHGADYGKWCASWEDGKTTPGDSATVLSYRNGSHTSTNQCYEHWPETNSTKVNYYNWSLSQSWCCDSWCYVDRSTCTDQVAATHGLIVEQSWTGADIYFSYGACADWRSRPSKPVNEPNGIAADLSQHSCDKCPYVKNGIADAQCSRTIDGISASSAVVLGAGTPGNCGTNDVSAMMKSLSSKVAGSSMSILILLGTTLYCLLSLNVD